MLQAIKSHTVVSLFYTLKQNDAQGEVIEIVNKEEPALFLIGVGSLLPKFEDNLEGLTKGGQFEFKLNAEEGYGEIDPEAVGEIPLDSFKDENGKIFELLKEGAILNMRNSQGGIVPGRVVKIGVEIVEMDFNHPLAGMNLHFSGEILDVRLASNEEVEHRHAHGPGGHHHH